MNLSKKILLYYKDFFIQLFLFFIVIITPLGNPFDYSIYSKEEFNFNSISCFLHSVLDLLFYISLYFFIPIIINIYLVRVNKFRFGNEDYKAMKILLLVSMNSFYLLSWMVIYTELIYRDFLMPLVFNLLGYILYVYFTKKPELNEV